VLPDFQRCGTCIRTQIGFSLEAAGLSHHRLPAALA
jgi:hypothetical protein